MLPLIYECTTIKSYLIAIIVGVAIYYLILYFWSRRWLYYYASKMHGPPCRPIIGNAMYFYGGTTDILENIMFLLNAYKSPLRVWLGHRLFFAITQPKDLEIILNHALAKEELYQFTKPVTGSGLFTATVEKWKRHRKIILPTFNQKILNTFVEVFAEQANILICTINNEIAGKGFVDIFPVLSRCSLDIICETAMGKKIGAQSQQANYEKWVSRAMEIVYIRMFQIWYHPNFLWNLTPLSVELNFIAGKMSDFMREIVVQKREEFHKRQKHCEKSNRNDSEFESKPKRKAFLDYMIELSETGEQLTDEEIIDEASTIMIAGSDSTASMDSFALIMMGMHQNVQDKVFEELSTVFGSNSKRNVTIEDLPKLVYLERVIKETLRLFPVGPVIVRALHDDIKLDSHILPKGSSCVLGIIHTHRDPAIWPNPLIFDPDRFLPEEIAKRHPYSFIPFSGGPRNCIGPKYAMMAMKSVLSTILRNFKVTANYRNVADVKIKADLMIRCVGGYQVALERRATL